MMGTDRVVQNEEESDAPFKDFSLFDSLITAVIIGLLAAVFTSVFLAFGTGFKYFFLYLIGDIAIVAVYILVCQHLVDPFVSRLVPGGDRVPVYRDADVVNDVVFGLFFGLGLSVSTIGDSRWWWLTLLAVVLLSLSGLVVGIMKRRQNMRKLEHRG